MCPELDARFFIESDEGSDTFVARRVRRVDYGGFNAQRNLTVDIAVLVRPPRHQWHHSRFMAEALGDDGLSKALRPILSEGPNSKVA